MDVFESSTREEIPARRSLVASRTSKSVPELAQSQDETYKLPIPTDQTPDGRSREQSTPWSGQSTVKAKAPSAQNQYRHSFRESGRTPRSTSCSLLQKLCSSNVYRIRPRPKDGSITFGVNSRTGYVKTKSHRTYSLTRLLQDPPFNG